MTDRYKVVLGSQSAHCCFDATVVDMTKPVMIGEKHYNDQYEAVCECFELVDAERVCSALNATNTDKSHEPVQLEVNESGRLQFKGN